MEKIINIERNNFIKKVVLLGEVDRSFFNDLLINE